MCFWRETSLGLFCLRREASFGRKMPHAGGRERRHHRVLRLRRFRRHRRRTLHRLELRDIHSLSQAKSSHAVDAAGACACAEINFILSLRRSSSGHRAASCASYQQEGTFVRRMPHPLASFKRMLFLRIFQAQHVNILEVDRTPFRGNPRRFSSSRKDAWCRRKHLPGLTVPSEARAQHNTSLCLIVDQRRKRKTSSCPRV